MLEVYVIHGSSVSQEDAGLLYDMLLQEFPSEDNELCVVLVNYEEQCLEHVARHWNSWLVL